MNEEVRSLLTALRKGTFDDPEEKIDLLAAALREDTDTTIESLLSLLRAEQAVVRTAAVLACKGRKEPEFLSSFQDLTQDDDERVRLALAKILKPLPDRSFTDILLKLCRDRDEEVRVASLEASAGNPGFLQMQIEAYNRTTTWREKDSLIEILSEQNVPTIVPVLFQVINRETDEDFQRKAAARLEVLFTDKPKFVERTPEEIHLLAKVEKSVRELGGEHFPRLLEILRQRTQVEISPEELKPYGTDLTTLAQAGTLPRSYELQPLTTRLAEILTGPKARSVVLLGESGVGKTSLVHDLTYHLAKPENGAWRVLRMAPTDFVTDTRYIGEWETRVNNLIDTVKRPRRVILYIPNIGELPGVGKHSKGDHNVLTALLPHIQDGTLLVLGESTQQEFTSGFASCPTSQNAFETVRFQEPDIDASRRILRQIRDQTESKISDEQLESMLELADQFMLTLARPGRAVRLFEIVHNGELTSQSPVSRRQILQALSTSTGLPVDLLDDAVPLDLPAAKSFFEQRVLGQPEAVEAVLDLVTLIKAGLTDPNKPMGVFMFIGPTGVGKTELARALADYIFGDPRRLLRFDMSEFAEAEGFQRLIGRENRGLLTDAVRQQPFSVVLLDEIEKSHVNVFDICLQLFDAGRLTDAQGRTTDFRRTILVLTSNIGASKPLITPLGFKSNGAQEGEDQRKEQTMRELALFFRPEFLNRIDRIVHFLPLPLEVAENIARKEVELVLSRSGITRRNLAVEVEPSALALLVKEGYSPHFGARPLKRAVERLLLIPLARVIASGRVATASGVRLVGLNGKIEAQLIALKERPKTQTPARLPVTLQERLAALAEKFAGISTRAEDFSQEKSTLVERTHSPEFYQDRRNASTVFDRIHHIEAFLAFQKRLGANLERLTYSMHKTRATPTSMDRQLKELEALFQSAELILNGAAGSGLSDALLSLTLVSSSGPPINALELLVRMYKSYAAKHRLTFEVLGESSEKQSRLYIACVGIGACALFKNEAGLHEFEKTQRLHATRTGREKTHCDRELIRLQVCPLVDEPPKDFVQELKETFPPASKAPLKFLEAPATALTLFHTPTMHSLTSSFSGRKTEAIARARMVFASQLATREAASEEPLIIRKYEIGIGSKARDLRTALSTSHLDSLFKGHLELLQP